MKHTRWKLVPAVGLLLVLGALPASADWPTLRGNVERTGYVDTTPRPPFRLAWARHFAGERLGTAMEPIVAREKVFVATHNGSLYALDALGGKPLWLFRAHGAFLHSPAYADGAVAAASTDGNIYALDAETGELRWSTFLGAGGCAASALVVAGRVCLGTRAGLFVALDLQSGQIRWRKALGAPIRQTASFAGGRVFVTAEDLRVRALDVDTGQILWTSERLAGQSARDYFPVVVRRGKQTSVVVCTNPVINMAQRIGQDRHFLCERAGVDDSGWQQMDAWTKSENARGTPELWKVEQEAITAYLETRREARSFYVLDAASGRQTTTPPVLWAAGCQGTGTPPVALPDGRLFVFYRSAYGNWNHGVAPLVALGFLDLNENRITPLFHAHGMRPPWNTFWGTADESQNFLVTPDSVLIVHQGTLSRFDRETAKLSLVGGKRDTWGGLPNLPWARNEWHGPARGGVAVVASRLYWLTGSRLLCFIAGETGPAGKDHRIDGGTLRARVAPPLGAPNRAQVDRLLTASVEELLRRRWAPLYVEPGLAGREFFFAQSGEVLEALAWAYPHLAAELQKRVASFLRAEWKSYPPYSKDAWYALAEGERRERFEVPRDVQAHRHPRHHPFGNLHAIWLYAERCREWRRVLAAWPSLKASLDDFLATKWRLDPERGHVFANRYLASLLACRRLAERAGDTAAARRAESRARQVSEALIAWWRNTAAKLSLPVFRNIQDWDGFRGHDKLLVGLSGHRAKVTLFHGLTPEVAELVRGQEPQAVDRIWRTFQLLCPTWRCVAEERQVHYGENFVDPPDLNMDAFKALTWLAKAPAKELSRSVDVPFCRADLAYLTKLALALEGGSSGSEGKTTSDSPGLWELANRNASVVRFSTLFTAQNVRDHLSRPEDIDRAIQWCRDTAVTHVYLETFRGGYTVNRDTMVEARNRFREAGFLVSGCVTTTQIGRKSVRGWIFPCFTEQAGLDELKRVFAFTAELFDEIMVDDFFATHCECDDCVRARGDRPWSASRCDLLIDVSRRYVLEPARGVNPEVKVIIKYPQWYEDFHNRGYEVVRQTAMFDKIWVGTETRDPDNARWGGKSQYEAYFIMRWLGEIGGEKCGGGWFDPFGTTAHTYLEQARQTILAGAREVLLFCYGALQRDTGPANVRALRQELPALFELARLVRGKPLRGVSAPRPPNSDAVGDRYVYDFVGLLGLPLVPSPEVRANVPAAFLSAHALKDAELTPELKKLLGAKTPLLVTRNLVKRRPELQGSHPDHITVLEVPDNPWSLMELAPDTLRTIRKRMLAPLGVDLDAPTRVSLYLFGTDIVVTENFNDRAVPITLRFRSPPGQQSPRKPALALALSQDDVSLTAEPGHAILSLPARSLVVLRLPE